MQDEDTYKPGKEALVEAQLHGKPLSKDALAEYMGTSYDAAVPPPSKANERQHGGDHYRDKEYQHWDWVYEMNLGYHVGNATKYVSRWRKKNGHQDLEKAIHYLDKASELDISPATFHAATLNRFCEQLEPNDAAIIRAIVQGSYEAAAMSIRWLMHSDTD